MIFHFNQFTVDSINYQILKNRTEVKVEPQVFDLIVYLLQHRDRLVSRQEILDHVWQGRLVSDATLGNRINSARKALGDNGSSQLMIKTVHGRGYQFINTPVKTEEQSTQQRNHNNHYKPMVLIVSLFALLLISYFTIQHKQSSENDLSSPYIRKVAVLPFLNNKPNTDTDYFGFALADQLIGELTYMKTIAVRPSSSIRKYSGLVTDPVEVGNELEVDYVISGNYLTDKGNIRLNIELIEVKTNQLIWRDKPIETNYENTFKLVDIVAQHVLQNLKLELSLDESKRVIHDVSKNPLAYEYYLRSIAYPMTTDGHQLAIEMLKKSIALDDDYAPTYVQLGNRKHRLEQFGLLNLNQQLDAEHYYLTALSLNPDLISALGYLAMFYTETNRIDEAMKLALRMYTINPNNADVHFTLGYIYRYAGMAEEAINEMEKAVSIDPKNSKFRSLVGAYSGVNQHQKALDLSTHYGPGSFATGWKALMFRRLGNEQAALALFNELLVNDPQGLWGHVATVHKAYMTGDIKAGLTAIAQLENTRIVDGETIYYTAAYYGLLGEKKRCLATLAQAVNKGYFNTTFINNSTYFDSVRGEPEFHKIMQIATQRHQAFKAKYF